MAERFEIVEKAVLTMLEDKKYATLRDILVTMNPSDVAGLFNCLEEKQIPLMYRLLPKELAAETFVEMEPEAQELLIRSFSDNELKEVLDELRQLTQVVVLSDTFEEFAKPLMKKRDWPTIFCNSLEVADSGEITGFNMRLQDSKLNTVKGLQAIGFDTIASGDSYNDLGMIQASKAGFLFRSTEKIKADYPDIPAFEEFGDLLAAIKAAL